MEKIKNADNGAKSTIGNYPISIPKYREVSETIGEVSVKYRELFLTVWCVA